MYRLIVVGYLLINYHVEINFLCLECLVSEIELLQLGGLILDGDQFLNKREFCEDFADFFVGIFVVG